MQWFFMALDEKPRRINHKNRSPSYQELNFKENDLKFKTSWKIVHFLPLFCYQELTLSSSDFYFNDRLDKLFHIKQ